MKSGLTAAELRTRFPKMPEKTVLLNAVDGVAEGSLPLPANKTFYRVTVPLPPSSPTPAEKTPTRPKDGAPRIRQRKESPDATRFFIAAGIPKPEREFRFERSRRWRMDYAWPSQKVALEVEGGIWTEGRHTRGKGFLGDMEKYNHAAVLGWRVVRVTPDAVLSGSTIELIKSLIG